MDWKICDTWKGKSGMFRTSLQHIAIIIKVHIQIYIAEQQLGPVAALSVLSASPMQKCTEIT